MRRLGLGLFFSSIGVNAALGIYAVLAPDFGEVQEKILGTSLFDHHHLIYNYTIVD